MSRPTGRGRLGDFDENSPRPPVPGEETESASSFSTFNFSTYKYTPRSSNLHSAAIIEGKAPLGFEPEGSCSNHGSCSPFQEGTRTPPSHFLWAKSLYNLLEDEEGVQLFKRYLEREGKANADALDFWFACCGLKKKPNKESINHLVKTIHRRYVLDPALGIPENLRKQVTSRIRENLIDKDIFDAVQKEIGDRITNTTYPAFLKSDVFISYISQIQNDFSNSSSSGSNSGSSSSSAGRDVCLSGGPGLLETVHEDSELEVTSATLPLTRDALIATQNRRAFESRPKPEAYAGIYLQHGAQLNTKVYSSYNPVSRQDSELQSLSSDARTDSDAMSCTDNSVDGTGGCQHKTGKRQHQRQYKAMKDNANLNRDATEHMIPRPQQKSNNDSQLATKDPAAFAQILMERLEAEKRRREQGDAFSRKVGCPNVPFDGLATLSQVLREKLQVQDDLEGDNQSILDRHVSRVFSNPDSPKPSSPDGKRKIISGGLHPYQTKSSGCSRYPRKDKDAFSTFSADSGNVHDFPDVPESGRHFPKSRSFPDRVDTQNLVSGSGYSRSRDVSSKRMGSKKNGSQEFDSGVSVISDTLPHSGKCSTERFSYKEVPERSSSRHRSLRQPSSAFSSSAHKHNKKVETSGSLERCLQSPYVIDGCVQAGSARANFPTQLEEARRRQDEDSQKKFKQRLVTKQVYGGNAGCVANVSCGVNPSTAPFPDLSLSTPSTLRKPARRVDALQQQDSREYTIVTYSFWDELIPYRSKVLGHEVTLKQFKDLLHRRGNFRYYFKTECVEAETKIIQEEVFDDNQILPLYEGKLVASVKQCG